MSCWGHLEVARDESPAEKPAGGDAPFVSILFPHGAPDLAPVAEPACFRDLNLDQVVEMVVAGREEYDLVPFFHVPLASVQEITYRHDVFRDLEFAAVRAALTEFGERMHRVRSFRTLARKQHYRPEQQRWLLDAADLYVGAVAGLSQTLDAEEPASQGLRRFSAHLREYVAGESFTALVGETAGVVEGLNRVAYTLRINGTRVTVGRYEDEPDYSGEIEELFARFRQSDVQVEPSTVPDGGAMDHVEAQIAQLVARLHPHEFEALDRFCVRHADFVHPAVAAFDREIQFYLAWDEHCRRLTGSGLALVLPVVSTESKREAVEDGFDLALAFKLGADVVRNGYRLEGAQRLLVVTGPNQGGKTTFARMFGQLHHLAALGVPVPARSAVLFLAERIFTHFEREEVAGSLRGRLDEELVRIREILEAASPASVVVLNEMFSSATLADARDLGSHVLGELGARGCLGVCVTFIDELSRLGEATVSMVAQVAADDPAVRTYRLLPRAADGRAYAWAIARKYGLSYEQLREHLDR